MTPDAIRAQLREAEDELDRLRGQMDAAVDSHGGHLPRELAEDFARRLEAVMSEIWQLKGRLRTPAPSP
jgi:hypothetical protein